MNEPESGPPPTPSTTPAPSTILNVDDNEANLYAVTRMLKRAGFAVVEAINGAEALRKVAELRPELVVLDVNLPDVDGFEVCRRIKADPATSSIPVLHMSASYILSEDRSRGLDEGSDGYLIRPVEPPELISTVRALLRIKSAEKRAQAAAHQWKATFDVINEGVCLLDRQGLVLRCNRAAGVILGLEPGAIVGKPLRDLVEPPDPPADLAVDGRWFRVALVPILDEGSAVGSAYLLTDVTDRRNLEDEIRRRDADPAGLPGPPR